MEGELRETLLSQGTNANLSVNDSANGHPSPLPIRYHEFSSSSSTPFSSRSHAPAPAEHEPTDVNDNTLQPPIVRSKWESLDYTRTLSQATLLLLSTSHITLSHRWIVPAGQYCLRLGCQI